MKTDSLDEVGGGVDDALSNLFAADLQLWPPSHPPYLLRSPD